MKRFRPKYRVQNKMLPRGNLGTSCGPGTIHDDRGFYKTTDVKQTH